MPVTAPYLRIARKLADGSYENGQKFLVSEVDILQRVMEQLVERLVLFRQIAPPLWELSCSRHVRLTAQRMSRELIPQASRKAATLPRERDSATLRTVPPLPRYALVSSLSPATRSCDSFEFLM